ncbi:MarR family winged helix-turn-helix transcriptional regulator [uncultured Jannaschia sp.]|uniref:MarR family winged helix-turn-helix transcriptional regulator n=1 Tax=uncultured Jannaschia sp. TaxID=293347 RepID=UPI002611D4D2|nr:MarR family transcriptional regulator [uncultured Jannaschia sp.]
MTDQTNRTPTKAQGDNLDAKLCFDVYATNLAFARLYAPLLEPHGLTYPQYLVLTLLWERDDRSMREIGETLYLRSNTLTPLLKRLAAAGYVERARSPNDERQVDVRLTQLGRDMRGRLAEVPDCVERATGLTEPEIRDLQRRLRNVRAHLLLT